MFETTKMQKRYAERGNVLFLILIAVALFAALSYAVTQSSRSGGGDANNETNLINSAQVTQYPSSVRTSIIRMMVSNSIDPASLEFNSPSDFSGCTNSFTNCVFHPEGGGATFVRGTADVAIDGTPREWIFNGENEVNLVGTTVGGDSPSATTGDIIAFLPMVKKSVCDRINEELGIGSTPVETGIDVTDRMGAGGSYVDGFANGGGGTIGEGGAASLNGQAFGCFELVASSDDYYYYHVLIEQ